MEPAPDPIAAFQAAFEEARRQEPADPTVAFLATADAGGRPSARAVLLKGVDPAGFVFYTNYESRKAQELGANPRAALCFYWPSTRVQVRVEGPVERVSGEESDAYFATRPRDSQLAAWASQQSEPLPSRGELEARFREIEERFAGKPVPRPPFWGGYRLVPEQVEFWQGREHRLHDRTLFVREGAGWSRLLLYP